MIPGAVSDRGQVAERPGEREVEAEVARLEGSFDATSIALRSVEVPARKSDIAIGEVALVWTPWRTGADGFPVPAFEGMP